MLYRVRRITDGRNSNDHSKARVHSYRHVLSKKKDRIAQLLFVFNFKGFRNNLRIVLNSNIIDGSYY